MQMAHNNNVGQDTEQDEDTEQIENEEGNDINNIANDLSTE